MRPRPAPQRDTGKASLTSSPNDYLGEVVRKLIACTYGRFDITMFAGKVVGRAWWLLGFDPHVFFRDNVAVVKHGWVGNQ